MNFAMGCIRCHSRFTSLVPSPLKHKHSKTNQPLWLSNYQPTHDHHDHHHQLLQIQNLHSVLPLRPPQSLPTSSLVFGGLTSPPPPADSGDISVFLQTSALLLTVYWVSNFVVPDLITKYIQTKNQSEEQVPKDEKPTRR